MRTGRWQVELSAAAEADLRHIVRWTGTQFGKVQARRYARLLQEALNALKGGPDAPGVRSREEIGQGYKSLHAARRGKNARHVILFRILDRGDDRRMYVVRVLHEAMDIARQVPPGETEE